MKKQILFSLTLLSSIILWVLNDFAQAPPAISYSTPQVFTAGIGISKLQPVNKGGALFSAIYGQPVTFTTVTTPFSIAIDKLNNIYTTNNSTGDLIKYNPSGNIIFTVNTGSIQASEVAVDGLGNIYVAQFTTNSILKYSSSGQLIATIADFNDPYGIAFDVSNNAYVADYLSGEIIKIAANDTVATTYASGLTTPYGVVVDANGNLYVSEQSVGNVIKIAAGTLTQSVFASGFNGPRHLSKDVFGNIYVADYGNNAVKRVNANGNITNLLTSGLTNPRQAAFDSNGNLFVADFGSNTLLKSTASIFSISHILPTGLNFDNTTGQISGTPIAASASKNYTITASNTFGLSSTTLAISVIDSSQILASLPTIKIFPPSAITTNTATISGFTNTSAGIPTVTITYSLNADMSGAITTTVPVNSTTGNNVVFTVPGLNPSSTYYYKVTSTNSTGTVISPVTSFTTLKNNDAALASLIISQGAIFPAFSAAVSTYTDSVSSTTNKIQLTALPVDTNSTITVNGITIKSGKPSAPVALNIGNNIINVIVTAQDSVTTHTYTLNVFRTKASQTINFTAFTVKAYGDKDFTPDAIATSGEILTYTSDNTSVATIVKGAIHIVGAGNVNITANQAGNSDYNAAPYVIQPLTISKAPLTITVNNSSIAYGDPIPSFAMTYSGFVNEDDAGKLTTLPLISTIAKSGSPVGTYPVTPGGAASNNYMFYYQPGALVIGQNKSSITFAAIPAKTYGDADFRLLSTSTSGLPVVYTSNDNNVAVVAGNTVHLTGAGTAIITASQTGDANFAAANSLTQSLTVGKASLTITANNANITYRMPIPALTVTYIGFVNGDNASDLTALPVAGTNASTSSPVGTYPITVNGAASVNYNFTYAPGTLTIGQINSTITFTAISAKTYGDDDFNLTSTSTSGLPVTYSSSDNNIATVNGNTVHIISAGTATIIASQAGDANFAAANNVAQALTVNKAALTVTASAQTKIYGSADPVAIYKISSGKLFNGDTFSGNLIRDVGEQAGAYAFEQGTLAVNNNYNFNFISNKLTISKAPLTVTVNNSSIAYGDPIPSFTITYSGFVNGDDAGKLAAYPVISTTAKAGSPLGTYPVTAGSAASNNYTFNYQPGNLTIGQNNSNITFAAIPAKIYGDADFSLSSTSTSGLPVTYTSSDNNIATVNGNTVHIVGAGIVTLTASQTGNANFAAASSVAQLLTVNKAMLTITAANVSIAYGAPIPALTVTYKGFVNGDNASKLTALPVTGTTASAISPAGAYPITVKGAAAANYNFAYNPATLIIGQINSTITFAAIPAKTYGDPDFNLAATVSSGLPVTYTSSNIAVAAINGNTVHIIGAGTAIITASQAGNANIIAAKSVAQVLTINKATLTITATNLSIAYGAPVPALIFTYKGFVNADDATKLTALPVASTTASANSPAGIYAITAKGATAANYNFIYNSGTLTIKQGTSTIAFAAISAKTYGDADFSLAATASSGLPVSYTSSNSAVATINGNTVHIIGAGTAIITASQPGNFNIMAAAKVNQTLTVNKTALTVTANNINTTYGQAIPALTVTYSGFVNGDNAGKFISPVSIKTNAVTGSAVGQYPIIVSGGVSGNYIFDYQPGTLTVSPNKSDIAFAAIPAKTYGDADFSLSATSTSGLPITYTSSDNTIATVNGKTIHIVGAGTTTITASQNGNTAAGTTQKLIVNKAQLTIAADDIKITYNSLIPILTATYSGFVNGDIINKLITLPQIKVAATTISPTGTYPITVSGAASNNYNFTYKAGTLTINLSNIFTVPKIKDPIVVHQAVSPNGDGINDFLFIQGIESYPKNRVSIINLSGTLISQINSYDNSSKVFNGHSNINGTLEKPGTYYYKIDYVDDKDSKSQTGFFVLKY